MPAETGARLVIFEKETILSPLIFQLELEWQGVTVLMLTTAYFNLIARHSPGAFAKLNYVTFGGEPSDPRTVAAMGFRLLGEKVRYLLQWAGSRLTGSLVQRLRTARNFFPQIKRLEKSRSLSSSSAVEVVLESNRQALSKYQLRPYPGQITLFRAEDPDDGYIYPIDNGWTRYAEGGLQIYKIPGQHQQIFVQPNVGVLAEQLEGCLQLGKN